MTTPGTVATEGEAINNKLKSILIGENKNSLVECSRWTVDDSVCWVNQNGKWVLRVGSGG